ncbi:MAG: hypothetical protein ACR2HZ_04320, partial [Gemmatimonadaceae bacterium]
HPPRPTPRRLLTRRRAATVASLVAAVATMSAIAPGCDSATSALPSDRRIIAAHGPELAVEWSELAYDIAYGEDQFLTYRGQRALAMMHLAMHDALQTIRPEYAAYAYRQTRPAADPLAAASSAAYEVLLATYPSHRAELAPVHDRWLTRARHEGARRQGVAIGKAAARAILERRANDGWDTPGTYEFRSEPGQYQTTPPYAGFVLQPGFRYATPFTFDDPARFRPTPPPPLASAEYAAALEEVRLRGDSLSTVRTPDQTGYAVWWMEFAESSAGRLARRLLMERNVELWGANRALALFYVSLFDGYVSNWDSKFEYNHWRPVTAVRFADLDGNPATTAHPDWVPLLTAPPFPEYASAHATGCAAAYEVLAATFGNETPFENTSLTAPARMPTRSFPTFRAAAEECADSRVQLGWHFRYSTRAGTEAGRQIAHHVMSTTLRRASSR